jgi:hypothetical protein
MHLKAIQAIFSFNRSQFFSQSHDDSDKSQNEQEKHMMLQFFYYGFVSVTLWHVSQFPPDLIKIYPVPSRPYDALVSSQQTLWRVSQFPADLMTR